MQEIIAQGMTYLWGIWRHKWLALAIAWVVALAGWAYVWKMPESYVASAKLYVDTNTVLRPLLQGLAITPDINQRVRMMSSTLFSRPNLEKLARMTDLDLRATTEAQQEALIDRLRDYHLPARAAWQRVAVQHRGEAPGAGNGPAYRPVPYHRVRRELPE
jgi:uncharacterized protein involved in exopolysaccharide biosynthesis